MNNLVTHHISGQPSPAKGTLYSYVFSGDGVYVQGIREGITVQFCIGKALVRGLPPLEPYFRFDYPKIKAEVMERILFHAQVAAQDGLEQLYHLCFDGEVLRLEIPEQIQTPVSCRPIDDGETSSLHRSIIEIHSHHSMSARFSSVDDADEKGFKIYGVIGKVLDRPEIRFRVGLHGYFFNIPAAWVCEMPDEIEDCN